MCRPEVYQIKSTTYYTLCDYSRRLTELASKPFDTIQKSVVAQKLMTVLRLYDDILLGEYSRAGTTPRPPLGREDSKHHKPDSGQRLADDMHTCDFCGADIFQSYFQCLGDKSALSPGEESFIICPGCYVEGRTCACQRMMAHERQSFDILLEARWKAIQALADAGFTTKSFKGTGSLHEQRRYDSNYLLHSLTSQFSQGTLPNHVNAVYFMPPLCYKRFGSMKYVVTVITRALFV